MSRINRIRIVNLNYNHNAIRIDDECFDLVNENTLLSLRNGGGKSVLIQMITAPFVHKRYRDAGERRFESYFTTNQPTFIMVEWSLDQEAGYVLTGMMVRKNQESKEEDDNRPELEMINFVHEYEVENEYDIKNFPLLIQDQNKKTLKGFHVCRQLFEQCKQNKQLKFDYYDMNQHPRSRAYFEKLEEFQIYAKEWESIIKKVNLKESGLSELFKDAKDEKGLTEKWFLEAVENKLNQNQDRMRNFESLLKKYILQYKANEGNFKRKEGILSFQEELQLILELENELLKSENDVHEYERKLAKLYVILEQLHQQATLEKEGKEEQLKSLKQQQHRLAYEQQSLQIYELIEQEQQVKQQKTDEKRHEQQLKDRQEVTLKQQHIYEAANRYQTYKQASVDVQRYESELAVVKQSQEALMPRLNDIGYSLSLIYESQLERETNELNQLRLHLQDVANEQKQTKNKLEVSQDDRQQLSSQIGRLESVVSQFDEVEQRFSAKYQEALRRNLEGFYAPNELESKLGEVKLQLEQAKKQKKQALEHEEQLKEGQHKISRDIEDAKQTQGTLTKTIEIHRQELQHLEEELEIRNQIRAYIAWSEDKILDTNGMIEALDQKRQIVMERMRDFERELDEKQKEKEQLTKGDVLPLPEHLKQRFDEEGIQFISGVDWLKKNQYSSEKNHQLIENNPFLPYSIILSATQMKQLKSIDLELKTSFPIPILIREELERESGINYVAGHCQFNQLHFYMYFNEELLDEHRLQQLVQLKEKEIKEIQDKHRTQQQYLTRYEEQINTLKYQKLSTQTYEEAKEKLDNCLKEQEVLHHQFMQFQVKKEQLREALDATSKQLQSMQEVIRFSELKLEDYHQLIKSYERYVQSNQELKECRHQSELMKMMIEELTSQQEELHETWDRLKASEREKQTHLENTKASFKRFEGYTEGDEIQKDVEDLLAEFNAINHQLDGSIRRSEEDLIAAKERFCYEEDQLHHLMQRYDLVDADYQQVTYDKFAHDQVIHDYQQLLHQLQEQSNVLHQLEIKVTELKTKKENAYDLLKRDLGETTLLDKSEIVSRDFEVLMAQNDRHLKQLKQEVIETEKRLAIYAREQSNLVEYRQEDMKLEESIDISYQSYDEKDWQTERGQLIRDYKHQQKIVDNVKHQISDEFNRISRLPLFEDDFFNRPLQRLMVCKYTPHSFKEQYDIIDRVFESLMKKLDVDIEMSEKEKYNVIQLLLDYISEVHKHLGLIDQNSSISVRGKNLKMLRIKLPDWKELESVYRVRMNDFVQTLTSNCMERLQKNENIEEFIGHQVTTKQLYDQIVGTANVEIKLYKIEEQREYQITWEQVSKNSGGEGFLSAFVILTSLLSFMRRDETDIFSNFEEGKVLLMDNPFAQTNAAHLLKPLIELAKKNNTQLICLSGLGGDSIYSRFENIYSLSLVPSSFKKGCEYLKSQHIKGEVEPHLVIPSRVYVKDAIQEALLF